MNSEQDISVDVLREQDQSGAGALLKRAREAQDLSLADIAARTRIPIRQLEVIEAGAFSSLPSRTYAIGFARTYAQALGLSESDITSAVRAELGDVSEPRTAAARALEPGDPAKLPSKGLAWAGAIAALLLAAGLFAWFSSYFGAGQGAPALVAEAEPAIAQRAPATDDGALTAGADGEVVFTALADGIWVRLFDEGGERFLEKTLTKGESFTVPATARDPRINTARPDALGVTIDGKPAAPLAARAIVLASEPVSAAVLLARGAGAQAEGGAGMSATTTTTTTPVLVAPARVIRRSAAPPAARDDGPLPIPTPSAPMPIAASPVPAPLQLDAAPASGSAPAPRNADQ
jgi:cytoskeletal protein RodZ